MKFESLYFKSPYFFQSFFLNIYGLFIARRRYNKNFHKYLNLFKSSNTDKIDFIQLKKFVISANETFYWKKQFEKFNVNINSTDLINELKKLPILNKKDVLKNFDQIYNSKINDDKKLVKTSGSTGTPLKLFETKTMENKQWAVWWRYRINLGLNLNSWCAWFGGRKIISTNRNSPPYWHINYFNRQIMFSAHHLSQSTIKDYYNRIKNSNISWIHGYPSQISFFASLIDSMKLNKLKQIKIITVGGENLMPSQIQIIEKVFDAKVFEHYGLTEGVANISQNLNKEFSVDNDFCWVNFIPHDKTMDTYKICGTNYCNLAFPLINYDTGDIAKIENIKGRRKIKSINGRLEDYIYKKNGVRLGRLDHVFKNISNVIESQIYQKKDYTVNICIVKAADYNKKDEENILYELNKHLGGDIDVSIQYVNKIRRSSSGKLKFVISEISL